MCETIVQQRHDFPSKDSAESLDELTAGLKTLKIQAQEKRAELLTEAQTNNPASVELTPCVTETNVTEENKLRNRGTSCDAFQSGQPVNPASLKNVEIPNRDASENTDGSASEGCSRVKYRNRGPIGGTATTYCNSKTGDTMNSNGNQNQLASIVLSAGKRQDCDGFDQPIKFMKNVNMGFPEANSPGQMLPQISPQSHAAAYNGHNINQSYIRGYADVNSGFVSNHSVTQQPFNNNYRYMQQQCVLPSADSLCLNGAQVNYGSAVNNGIDTEVHFIHGSQMQMLQPQQHGFSSHSSPDFNNYAQNGFASYGTNQPMPVHHHLSVPAQFNFGHNSASNQAFISQGQQQMNVQQFYAPAAVSAQQPSPIQASAPCVYQVPVLQQQFGVSTLPMHTFNNLQMLNVNGTLVVSPNQQSNGNNIPVPVTALSNPSPSYTSSTHIAHSPGAPSPKNNNKNQAIGMPKHRDSKSLSVEAVAPSPSDSGYEESLSPKTPGNVGTPQTPDSIDVSSLGSPQLPEPESAIIPDLEKMLPQDGATQMIKRRGPVVKYQFSEKEKEMLECFQEFKNEEEEANVRRANALHPSMSIVSLPSGMLVVTMSPITTTSALPATPVKPRPILPKPEPERVPPVNTDKTAVAPLLTQTSAALSSQLPAAYIDSTITDDLGKLINDAFDLLPDADKVIDEADKVIDDPIFQELWLDAAANTPEPQLLLSTSAGMSNGGNQPLVNSDHQLLSPGVTGVTSIATIGGTGGNGGYKGPPLPLADAAVMGGSAMTEQMKRCQITVYMMSEDKMVYVDEDGDNNLHIVVCDRDNNIEMLQCLLERARRGNTIGQLINARNNNDRTPLLEAVYRHRVGMVRLLLAFGADVNVQSVVRSPSGEQTLVSPVLLAAERGELYVSTLVELLQAPGTNIDIRNHKDFTPLHVAVEAHGKVHQKLVINSALTIKWLLSRGASFAARGGSSKTPLYCAVEKKDLAFLHFIRDLLPADVLRDAVNIPMDSDQTCLHIAAGFSELLPLAEHEAIVTLLLECGANPRATIRRSSRSRPYECVIPSRPTIAALILSRVGNGNRQ